MNIQLAEFIQPRLQTSRIYELRMIHLFRVSFIFIALNFLAIINNIQCKASDHAGHSFSAALQTIISDHYFAGVRLE